MKLEEYTDLINKIVSDPDTAEETGSQILEALKADDTARAEQSSLLSETKEQVKTLKSQIFQMRTGQIKEEPKQEKTPKDIFNELFDKKYYSNRKEN